MVAQSKELYDRFVALSGAQSLTVEDESVQIVASPRSHASCFIACRRFFNDGSEP
jgi:hypothetical protein